MNAPTRVLIVDDSPTARAVLHRLLSRQEGLEVVGEAKDGAEAVAAAQRLAPDVIVMDLEMPVLDGFGAIQQIVAERSAPVVVLSARAGAEASGVAFRALRAGAAEVLEKPQTPAEWERLATTLPRLLRALHRQRLAAPAPPSAAAQSRRRSPADGAFRPRYLAVGASTGGPDAIRRLLVGLDADRTLAILVVQHIVAGFEEGLAQWLRAESRRDVRVARDGEPTAAGVVHLAPADAHLALGARDALRLDREAPPRGGHRPSVDELLSSCARLAPRETVGVLLTGMGADGAEGLTELARAGGRTLVQDEASCVIFGMPRAALRRGAAELALPPEELGRTVASWARGENR